MQERFAVACGTGKMEFTLPPGMRADVVRPRLGNAVDLPSAAQAALMQPVSGPSLAELARPGQRVCIVFTDATRDVPDQILVSALLAQLHEAGIRRQDVVLLCGVGMHRPSTPEEKAAKLGADVASSYRILDSEPRSVSDLVHLGDHDGIPLWVSRPAAEADLLLATGIVEPHQYAGFSGGRKTVAIGAGGEPTIAATHSPSMIERDGVRLGNLADNPFHLALVESARRAGLRFVINVVRDGAGNVVEVAAGEPQATLEHLAARARQLYEVQLDRRYDIVVAGVGHPKDANIYQASRAVTYTYFAPSPVLAPGGVIIIPAPCAEGVGQGVGEQRFAAAMRAHPGPDQVVSALRHRVTLAGEQRSYLLARALQGCRVIFVGTEAGEEVEACHMTAAPSMEEAFHLARQWTRPDADVLVAPHSLLTVLRGPDGP
ncbi:MAG: nickel-dependent lactate racemase [Anaerolineae bacterium]|nr:nickel-dependent lactate racemase [Anaerolineae bacterium]